ncbi:hypothetical protein EDB85DRAFT_230955 [Lactarius pseudohatsudake]|nr:hypothetical protein EDB85DRAFT_230955 [Lactarius pseudohatsudake]
MENPRSLMCGGFHRQNGPTLMRGVTHATAMGAPHWTIFRRYLLVAMDMRHKMLRTHLVLRLPVMYLLRTHTHTQRLPSHIPPRHTNPQLLLPLSQQNLRAMIPLKSLRSCSLAPHDTLCSRLSIHFYRLFVFIFSPWFSSVLLFHVPHFFVLFIPLRSALNLVFLPCRLLPVCCLVLDLSLYLYFCVCTHLSLSGARRMHCLVSHFPTPLASARNPFVRARDNMLWANGCTARLLPGRCFTRQGLSYGANSIHVHNEWFSCVERPCGDSARC